MNIDQDTYRLFEESSVDAYDSNAERYPMVLRAGVAQHGLALSDVLAVTNDMGFWAICRTGVFHGSLRGLINKRAEVGPFTPYTRLETIRVERDGPHANAIVLGGGERKPLAKICFSPAGPGNSIEAADAHLRRVHGVLTAAAGRSR
jgi:hypothetical protein